MPLQTISAMKAAVIFSIAVGLAVPAVYGQLRTAYPERQSLRVYQTVLPVFPRSMLDQGIFSGDVRIVLDVDEVGTLSEWLVVGYTHKNFADSVVGAVKRWHFDPMLVQGEPVPSQVELDFNFKSEGVVISSVGFGSTWSAFAGPRGVRNEYWPRSLQDLDRIPIPLVATRPDYPSEFAERGILGDAVIEFYIDEDGAVRMPAVVEADFYELGALAVSAVKGWSFEPATVHNQPVLVKARQVFEFGLGEAD
jgi:TonB family protein